MHILEIFLSHDVTSGSDITPCIKIEKLVVLQILVRLCNDVCNTLRIFTQKHNLKVVFCHMTIKSNIPAPVLLNLKNLPKRDKMLGKPHISSLYPNSFNKFNKTGAHM